MKSRDFFVGILAGESKRGKPFKGNVPLFIQLQKKIGELHGEAFVFPPSAVYHNEIAGYQFIRGYWVKKTFPYPDVVYNRYPYRKDEQTIDWLFQRFAKKNVALFNRHFFHKWDVYRLLQENDHIKPHLPKTKLCHSDEDILQFLKEYHFVYIKPVEACQGNGIFTIEHQNGTFTIRSPEMMRTAFSEKSLLKMTKPFFQSTPYIIQQGIRTDTIDGKKYDLRLYIHRFLNDYVLSGIGVRVAGEQSVTTHVPKGGKIVPFTDIQSRFDIRMLQRLCNEMGHTLTKQYGLIGEFSADLGRCENGHLYLFEVNAKPMKFDELAIAENGMNNLVTLFQQLAMTNI